MIKFFRHIRESLIMENKTSKYLKYAIGEILLVVIGILIALQINNWNEQRQKNKSLKNIYAIIADDLKNDASEVKTFLSFMELRKSNFESILADSLTIQEIKDNEIIQSILTDIRIVNIEKRGFNLLRNFENSTAKKNDSLAFRIINFYTSSIFYAEKVERLILDDLIKTNDYWKNKNWYAAIMRNNPHDEYFNYIMKDQEFKNLCAFRYSLYYENYVPTIEQFQDGSTRIIAAINERFR